MDPPDLLGGGDVVCISGCCCWIKWIVSLLNIIFYSLYLSAGLNSARGIVTSSTHLIPKADFPKEPDQASTAGAVVYSKLLHPERRDQFGTDPPQPHG